MIRISRKNPGIFVKDNSSFEFDKYRDFIEEFLLKELITVQNISYKYLIKLIDNLDLSKIVIERFKPNKPEKFAVFLKLDFPDERFGRFKNFTFSLLILESIVLFDKMYVYVPLFPKNKYDFVTKNTNIYSVIRTISDIFIETFVVMCKSWNISEKEIKEIKELLKDKFKRVLKE